MVSARGWRARRRVTGLALWRRYTRRGVRPAPRRAKVRAMSSVQATAVSGLQAAQARLAVSAHNVANAATPGFRRQQLALSTDAGGGVATTVVRAPEPGAALERDVVEQLQARHEFAANLAVFRTADRMTGTLLDALG